MPTFRVIRHPSLAAASPAFHFPFREAFHRALLAAGWRSLALNDRTFYGHPSRGALATPGEAVVATLAPRRAPTPTPAAA